MRPTGAGTAFRDRDDHADTVGAAGRWLGALLAATGLIGLWGTNSATADDWQARLRELERGASARIDYDRLYPQLAQAGQQAQAADRQDFDIQPQALSSALTQFGRQSGLQIAVDAGLISDLQSQGIQGIYTPEQALHALLAGTGLEYQFTAANSVTLDRAGMPEEDGATRLDTITVTSEAESAYGPVEGYNTFRSATATKTDTPIIETPASVQVVPRQVMEDQGAMNLKDVYENVSGVSQAGNTLNAQSEVLPIIRGFESPTLFRNGLRSTQSGAVDLVNVERVEVLKGPASILFGALQPGGIVNYVTKRPQAEAQYALEQYAGSYRNFRTTADATGPITDDGSLLYRANVGYTNAESFRDSIELERLALAPSILWMPTEQTEVLLDASFVLEEQPFDTGIPISEDGDPMVPDSTFVGDPDLDGRDMKDYVASYQLTHEFNDNWSVRNQFQFHRADNKNESIRARGVAEVGGTDFLGLRYQNEERQLDEYQFVLDTTVGLATGGLDHKVLFGADVLYQEDDAKRFRQNIPTVVLTDDLEVDFDPPADQQKEPFIKSESVQTGLYLQDQISLLADGRLKLLLGGRFDVFRQESEFNGAAVPDVREEAFTGRAGVLYALTDQHSVYASLSQSFIPHRGDVFDASRDPLDPEEGLQYEVGIKSSFFEDRLVATASVYQIDKENVAVFDNDLFIATGQEAYFPGVKERSRGFELDLTGALTDQINVIANYAFTDSEVLENLGDPTMVGEPLGGVPAHKARVWLTYSFDKASPLSGLGLGGGLRYVGSSTAQFDTDVELDPYIVVDAAAWYEWKSLRFGLNVQNLFDQKYIARANNRAIAHPGEPLTVLGSLSLRF